jgi:hypothetical protein
MLSNDDPAIARQEDVDSSTPSHHKSLARHGSARYVSQPRKRNYMFSNWIYRGMPTIVLLVVAGIIEFIAIRAFA